MGEVWKGADDVLGRPVAVKMLRAEYAQHPRTLARFRAEARHASALSHPGIAQVYDYGAGFGSEAPYLVMELVDGPPFAQVLDRGPLDAGRTMDLVAQAAAGLQAAYRSGLVHRARRAHLSGGPPRHLHGSEEARGAILAAGHGGQRLAALGIRGQLSRCLARTRTDVGPIPHASPGSRPAVP